MSLATTIQKAAQTAFKAIGDIPLTCTYTSKGSPVYNTTTGVTTSTDVDYAGLNFVFEDFKPRQITDSGGVILSTDKKVSIPNLTLVPTPSIADFITDSDGIIWYIKDILIDPARALWLFQVRRQG